MFFEDALMRMIESAPLAAVVAVIMWRVIVRNSQSSDKSEDTVQQIVKQTADAHAAFSTTLNNLTQTFGATIAGRDVFITQQNDVLKGFSEALKQQNTVMDTLAAKIESINTRVGMVETAVTKSTDVVAAHDSRLEALERTNTDLVTAVRDLLAGLKVAQEANVIDAGEFRKSVEASLNELRDVRKEAQNALKVREKKDTGELKA